MSEKEKSRQKILRGCFLLLFTAVLLPITGSAKILADEGYSFEEYYDPEEDGWANEERVNMDGELSFTVPDMNIVSIDLIVYSSGNPKLQEIRNSKKQNIGFKEKHTDNNTYAYYTVSDVSKGKWSLKVSSSDIESTKVFLIYHSKITARYIIDEEIGDPDSGYYQALIRLYNTNGKVLKLSNRKVEYLIDDWSLMSRTTKNSTFHCYVGDAGLDEEDMKMIGEAYSFHVAVTSEDGSLVLVRGEHAENSEFDDIRKEYNPSWWEQFRAKPGAEQRNLIMITVIVIMIAASGVIFLKKGRFTGKRKNQERDGLDSGKDRKGR